MECPTAPTFISIRAGRFVRAWTCLWCVLATLHVTQSIWTSGGRAYPGDLADGRFNQLVFEHGYQALRGVRPWASPAQFYPVSGTLAYSDTHAGTLALYAAARWLSVSREEAWQIWFVVVAALNAWAACRLLRALGVHPWLRGPLVFASAGSATLAWVACTHVQMLPMFPALLAGEQILRWREDRLAWRSLTILGWLSWQFAASLYGAFFSVVVMGLIAVAFAAVGRGVTKQETKRSATGSAVDWLRGGFVFLVGGGLAAATLAIYVPAIRAGYARPVWQILVEAPRWSSWFRAPPIRAIPAFVPAIPGRVNLTEHCWFAGWIAWALLLAIVCTGWHRRHTATGRWMLALTLVALATPAIFTKWTADGDGAWIWIARRVEALRAFRASGRVAVPLQFVVIGAVALLLTQWLSAARRSAARIAVVALACALALENVCVGQRATLSATARARTQAMVDAWKAAGDRPVLVYAPTHTDETPPFPHLDAWSAALQLHRVTVNGYSGGAPDSHMGFMQAPTPDNARATLEAVGLRESDVSFVDQPIRFASPTDRRPAK
ncbi:MAG TPA: hypothetical protein VHD62_11280 [Opitutaceae bacterium]|nr:hypothetical protein [Opitutaceae bacterium]